MFNHVRKRWDPHIHCHTQKHVQFVCVRLRFIDRCLPVGDCHPFRPVDKAHAQRYSLDPVPRATPQRTSRHRRQLLFIGFGIYPLSSLVTIDSTFSGHCVYRWMMILKYIHGKSSGMFLHLIAYIVYAIYMYIYIYVCVYVRLRVRVFFHFQSDIYTRLTT